jgi:nicotinamidase-related amidase
MKNKKALLIIDMQKGSFSPATPRYDAQEVVNRINKLSDQFRKEACPVIFIQHDASKYHCFVPNTLEWELLDELNVSETDWLQSKTANDSFYQTDLEEKLHKHGIKELVITGCATDFCVESTIQSALTKDFDLTVVKEAHTTADRPHLSAKKIIEHYNWVWSDLTPTQGKIEVIPFSMLYRE